MIHANSLDGEKNAASGKESGVLVLWAYHISDCRL